MKKIITILLSVAVVVSVLSLCFAENSDAWKNNTGTVNLDTMAVTGGGITVEGNIIYISKGGDFTVTGTQDNGMIQVNTEDKVKLRLSGMSLTNLSGPAIFFENTEKGFITVTENTENFLTDGAQYSVEDADAALFSNDDLEIKGNGVLIISANYKHGIASDDDLSVENGSITIVSQEHGIKVNDDLNITGGTFHITAKTGKGMKAGKTLVVDAGTINIVSEQSEGMESKGTLTINGGDINITAADDGINTGSESTQTSGEPPQGGQPPRGGNMGQDNPPELPNEDNRNQGNRPDMMRGQIPDDFQGSSGKMKEGVEKQKQPMNDKGGRGGMGGFGRVDEETAAAHAITINGGNIYLSVGGDGIDSNGSLTITGGKIIIDGPEGNGDGPLDSEGTMSVTGGEIITLSSAGMIQLPQGLKQNILKVFFSGQGAVNDKITVKNADGKEIMTRTAAKKYAALVYSSPALTTGDSYSIYVNDALIESAIISEGLTSVGTAQRQMQGGGRFDSKENRQWGNRGISVSLDGQNVRFDTNPVIKNDTTLVGFRAILEALGAEVSWNDETQTVTAKKDGINIILTINSTAATVNGEEKTLLTAPEIINDSTMIPVRFISEQLGMAVDWNEEMQHVSIVSK